MKEYALTINLKDDPKLIEEYKAYHRDVWPEVLHCLREIGITDMKIWLLGRRMFMLMQAVDSFEPARDFKRAEAISPRYGEWQTLMNNFQECVPEAQADEHWAVMEKVFEL